MNLGCYKTLSVLILNQPCIISQVKGKTETNVFKKVSLKNSL